MFSISNRYKFFERGLFVAMFLGALVSNVGAQTVQITGSGGSNLMAYLQWFVNLVWWVSLGGCFLEICFAGYKLATGNQQGMDFVKKALAGTVLVAGASGIFKYVVFGSQGAGVSNNNDLF